MSFFSTIGKAIKNTKTVTKAVSTGRPAPRPVFHRISHQQALRGARNLGRSVGRVTSGPRPVPASVIRQRQRQAAKAELRKGMTKLVKVLGSPKEARKFGRQVGSIKAAVTTKSGKPAPPSVIRQQVRQEARKKVRKAGPIKAPIGGSAIFDPDSGRSVPISRNERVRNAQTIYDVAKQLKANRKVLESAMEGALVESELGNIKFGDRDSQGLYQQRPAAGWGTPKQITNPKYAARKFIQRSKQNYSPGLTSGQLAQKTQGSAFPDRYDQRSKDANRIIRSLKKADRNRTRIR